MSDPNASNPGTPEATPANEPAESVPAESFKDIFSEYEQSHSRKRELGAQGREGTVIAVTADSIVLDIGFKTEGVLPLTAFPADKPPKPGDKVQVTTRRGTVALTARADGGVPDGVVFIPFAYVEAAANLLTNPKLDPFGKIPEFKFCAAKVEAVEPVTRVAAE